MAPDFSSIESDSARQESGSAFRPTQSVTEMMRRKRERARRGRARAFRHIARYAAYVACIALFAGFAQFGTGLYHGVPIGDSAWFVVRTLCGGGIGAFVGLAIVSFFIISPVVPMGPVIVVRLDPNIADAEQEKDESRALLGAGILFALIGSLIASATISIDHQLYSAVSTAGVIGSFVGVVLVIFIALLRRSRDFGVPDAQTPNSA